MNSGQVIRQNVTGRTAFVKIRWSGENRMEELVELKTYIEQGDYTQALSLIGEMEEMSREDKINKIFSYIEILILHMIKQHAEKRSTRSWEGSIRHSIYRIHYTNKRKKSGGYYCSEADIQNIIEDAYPLALLRASFEAFEGRFDDNQLAGMVDEKIVKAEALKMIMKETLH
jgi:hypothetical protein